MDKLKQFLLSHIEDFLIFIGLFLITFATFLLSFVAGVYVTGVVFLLLGVYFTIHPFKLGR